jgi:acetoin utilization deacetylase AcuC-like enzyme
MSRVAVVEDPLFLLHETGGGHPERPARLRAVAERLKTGALRGALEFLPAEREASDAEIALVHDPAYWSAAAAAMASGPALLDEGDTVVCGPPSLRAVRRATGAALALADRALRGELDAGFALVRPPGHHAERTRAMGFCVVNHVAVLARYLQLRGGLARVAIVDFDVHHGNGTQSAFYEDGSVFFCSLHQFPHWPGSGRAEERGRGAGEGTTLNLPLAPGSGPDDYFRAFGEQLLPALAAFRPQALVISAGFDAHRRDPLSSIRLESDSYFRMTAELVRAQRAAGGGPVLSVLEGGYDLEALAESAEQHLMALLELSPRGTEVKGVPSDGPSSAS